MDDSSQTNSFWGFSSPELQDSEQIELQSDVDVSDVSSVHSESLDGWDSDDGSDLSIADSDDEFEMVDSDWEPSDLSQLSSQASVGGDVGFWSPDLTHVTVPDFTSISGPSHNLPAEARPVDYFSLLCPDRFFDTIALLTNLYARQQQADHGQDRRWTETDVAEVKAFFGLLIFMGIIQMPMYSLYWSGLSFLHNAGFCSTMTLKRFEKLLQYIHVVDNTTRVPRGRPGYDRLFKIRPLLDIVHQTFRRFYKPRKNQTIDEAMVKYKGRDSIKQYMPYKPIKRGLKVWMRCDSESGYCHQLDIYLGRQDDNRGRGLGTKVVKSLCKDIKRKNHHIYTDRFFTSVELFQTLQKNGIYACGTINQNAIGLPEVIKHPHPRLRRGQYISRQHDNMVATVWQDTKQVQFLSTNSDGFGDGTALRRQRDGVQLEIARPPIVKKYQQYMAGVDRNNQLRSKYPVGRPSKKCWKYIMPFIINLCLVNSFIILKETGNFTSTRAEYRLLDFHIDVATQLVGGFSSRKRHRVRNRPQVAPVLGHTCTKLISRTSCKWCPKHGDRRRKTTSFGCSVCNIYLCPGACFAAYHEKYGLAIQ